jgi:hypothetical protein
VNVIAGMGICTEMMASSVPSSSFDEKSRSSFKVLTMDVAKGWKSMLH